MNVVDQAMDYRAFLEAKDQHDTMAGFEPVWMPEVYGALCAGRKAIGMELKPSYYRQAEKNVAAAREGKAAEEQREIFHEDAA